MRNLKRALSLALASVMLLGMMVVGTSAASTDFADVDDIKNVYAVDITTELGIFSGKGGNNFGATDAVNRAEMATLIVKMLKGADFNANAYKAITLFSDIPADMDWAKGYINYAAQTGILAGYPDGTFKPEATVNTAEAVTFIINALKVDAGEGTWPNTVMTKAVEMELFADLALGTYDALTRDDLAVLLVEGLLYQAPGTGKYKVDITTAGSASAAVIAEAEAQVFTSVIEASLYMANLKTAGLTNDVTVFVVEPVPANNTLNAKFGLVRIENGTDLFGRAATNYTATVEGFEKLTYDVATPKFVYEGGVDAEEIAKDLKDFTYTATELWEDGVKSSDSTINEEDVADAAASNVTKVEVFTKKTGTVTNVEKIIVTNTYATLAQKATEDIKDGDEVLVAKDGLYILTNTAINLDGVAENDVVLYTKANNVVQTVAAATKITGKMTSYTNDGVFTIAGGEYVIASSTGRVSGYSAVTTGKLNTNWVYYVGINGTIVKDNDIPGTTTETPDPTDYAVVLGVNSKKNETAAVWPATGVTNSYTVQVQVATSTGAVKTYELKVTKASAAITGTSIAKDDLYVKLGDTYYEMPAYASFDATTVNNAIAGETAGKLYNYSVNSSDVITLGEITAIGEQDEAAIVVGAPDASPAQTVDKTSFVIKVDGEDVVVDATTKFVFVTYKDSDPTKTKSTVKTGIASLYSTTLADTDITGVIAEASDAAADALYVAKYVFVDAVAVPTAPGASVADVAYIDGNYTVTKSGSTTVYTYTGIKADGSIISLTGAKNLAAGVYEYDTDNKLAASATVAAANAATYTKVSETVVKVGENYYSVNADTVSVIIADGAKLETGCKVLAIVEDDVVNAFFVTVAKPTT